MERIIEREKNSINSEISTGEIEISISSFEVLGSTKELPLPVFSDQEYSEEVRLKYRFLAVSYTHLTLPTKRIV